jgi:hypothetical protein
MKNENRMLSRLGHSHCQFTCTSKYSSAYLRLKSRDDQLLENRQCGPLWVHVCVYIYHEVYMPQQLFSGTLVDS